LRLRLAFQARALLNRWDPRCPLARTPRTDVASPDCFGSLTTVWLADILGFLPRGRRKGLHLSSRMLPLCCSGQLRAPWSPSTCTRLLSLIASSHRWESLLVGRLWRDFPTTLIVFPSCLSHLAVPTVDLSHSLAFVRFRRVKSTTCSGLHVTPVLFGPAQSPLAAYRLRQAPTTIANASLPKPLFGRSGRAGFSPAFAVFHPVRFFPHGHPDRCCKPYDTAFDRFAPVSPDHVLGMHATPVPRSGTVLPNLSSGSRGSSRFVPLRFRCEPFA